MIDDNNATYSELLRYYQPRKIESEKKFNVIKQIRDDLLNKDTLNEGQYNLLYLLELLIKDYEIKIMYKIEDYDHALNFAAKAHNGQKYFGTELPYLYHVVSVAHEVIYSLDMDERNYPKLAIQCALLHDVIEDTEYNYGDIKLEFGVDVAEGVLALTKDKTLLKNEQIKDSILRIKQLSPEIGIVKLADRICNLKTSPDEWSLTKKSNYLEESIFIYEELQLHHFYLAARLHDHIYNYNRF